MTHNIGSRLYNAAPNPAKKFLDKILSATNIGLVFKFYFGRENVLKENGWFQSERMQRPVDKAGNPIPWWTYPSIKFLDERLNAITDISVLETGSGYSTLWWAERADNVTAIEHHEGWSEEVRNLAPSNVSVVHAPRKNTYVSSVNEYDPDILVIDGEHRRDIAESAMNSLSEEAVIIWDDLDWLADEEDYQQLMVNGYQLLPFHGMKAHASNEQVTGIFYRPSKNCLEI